MTTQGVVYEEEQAFSVALWWALLGTVGFVAAIFASIVVLEPEKADALVIPGVLSFVIIGGISWLLSVMRLKVRVEADHIHVHFFPFLKKDIPLADVAHWEARTYRPIVEYGGWGIRMSWGGKDSAYNARGNRGVQLQFIDGKRLLIGSQHPEEFAEAITVAKRRQPEAPARA